MDTTNFENLKAHSTRFCFLILLSFTFVVSVETQCDDYNGIKNSNDDGDEGWRLHNFNGTCSICLRRKDSTRDAKLILPCTDQNQQSIQKIIVSYVFYCKNDNCHGEPLSQYNLSTGCENNDTSGNQLQTVTTTPFKGSKDVEDRRNDTITIIRQREDHSYRLKLSQTPKVSIICLTKVELSVRDHTTTTRSHSSTNGNQNTASEQKQSKSPIWVIFVIIAIVIISICAVAVFIRRRKQHDHQPANNVNTGSVDGKSNGIKDNMKNDKDVIANPTYGHETVNEKDEEYHSYTEIDVKIPDNSEMIYNSAYESQPASSDMVYNSAYESPPASSDMVYNSAYESSS